MIDDKRAFLRTLAHACHTSHCWVRTPKGPRRIDQTFGEVQLSEHIAGTRVYGLCPIKPGEMTTRVGLLDLDSHKGETPWAQMMATADKLRMVMELDGMRPVMFRSSGGSGVHIMLLWEQVQDAFTVREYLRQTLCTCGLIPGAKGVGVGEVEVFPKQDFVPPDGYGSMFILPLGGGTRSEWLP